MRELGLNEGSTDLREQVVFHSLRHTAASMMLAVGCDIRSLQSLFGWSTLQMAQRYTHAVDEVKKRAVTMLENMLSPSNTGKVVPFRKVEGEWFVHEIAGLTKPLCRLDR